MLKATDTKHAPWHIVRSDDKRRARLNCIAHILTLIPYKKVPRAKVKLPKRSDKAQYDDQATLKGRNFLQPYFQEERKKGVLAVDAKTPSTLLAHKAGYIDRDNEVIVGLQTDQPFKRAIFPVRRPAHGRERA